MATSPRRPLTPEEKKARDDAYRVDLKTFGEILATTTNYFNCLVALNSALGQAGKGAYLLFPNPDPRNPGQMVAFNRKQLRSANAKFSKHILSLKNYLRVAKKKTRDPVRPESFSGTYTPVYAGDALRSFFNTAPGNFGPLAPIQAAQSGEMGVQLMDRLPMVRQGYLLRNTTTMLFYIYAHQNQLQDAVNAQFASSDDVMTAAFGGEISASFFSYRVEGGKTAKVRMETAVESGLIPRAMNTYQVISNMYPIGTMNNREPPQDVGFRPDRFNTYYYQNIAAANYFPRAALAADPNYAQVAEFIARDDIRQAMLNEHNIVKAVSDEWHSLLEPGRKVQRDARKKEKDRILKAQKAAQAQAQAQAQAAAQGAPQPVPF